MLGRTRALYCMKICRFLLKHQVFENEASKAYKDEIRESGMTYPLVPPDDHWRIIAEKSIQTCKDHFIGVLSGKEVTSPMNLWFQTIFQAEKRLLLFRKSQENLKKSAYAHLYGTQDYNALPFVLIVMEALIDEKPTRRRSCSEHCKNAYILGT